MLDQVLAKFPDAATTTGKSWTAPCPAHDDHRASLTIGTGADGRVLIHCHAGCATEEVLSAAGLTWDDLFADRPTTKTPREVAAYDYRDEAGTLLYQVVRFDPKDFRMRRPDGAGGWTWQMAGVRRVLFDLPSLKGRSGVFIVEGEKDALELKQFKFVVTTNAGGAGKWDDAFASQLKAAGVEAVCVVPDNDHAGHRHADTVARSCHTAGLQVRYVTLPGLPPKGDVSDWFKNGGNPTELDALCKCAPIFDPVNSPWKAEALEFTSLGDLLAEPEESVRFLVEDRIPIGSLNLLAGKPKDGKSTLARALAFEVARGGTFMGSRCLQRSVWYIALEDKRSEVHKHFQLMGATGAEPIQFVFPQSTTDIAAQLHKLAERDRPGLIIVDTLQRLINAKDLNDYAQVTAHLTPFLTLVRETDAALLFVHHAGKAQRAGIDAVLGSTALSGSVDNVFLLVRTEKYRVLSSQQRVGPELPATVVVLDPATGRMQAGVSRHEADRAAVEEAILAALARGGEPFSEAQIDEAVEARTAKKREALRALLKAERISRIGAGGKGDPFRYSIAVPAGAEC